ncbi:Non-repetitive/WGA-negative nucleoporin C-terminal-domain-containing protein [Gigaspora rosea]|uniref:Non-repetitive/WGA-negative nucleoporin C-terminal-domain-containing protein n=1 Tax=Gigaspora rosea TaxID=44941 RepID=A0A397U3T2_9GLOM|nr:Non-repetitive/WGA-negative nucleoporin C-terminal-domain-containing protein [Gigaspora rosea]
MAAKEDIINAKVALDNRFLGLLFRQGADRGQDRYKEVIPETVPFKQEKIIQLPPRLREIVESTTHGIHVLLGCLPYINAVYFVVNDNLFIWEYDKGINDNAIAHIDVHPLQDQIIKSVGLVKPRADRFIDNAHYVLVIATDKAIYVFGFSSTSDGIVFHDMSSDRYRTDYSKKEIGSIIGTEDGRIFLIDAGELCELVYEDEGWFSKPCRLEIHSQSTVSQHLRWIWQTSSDFKSIAIDDTRHMLYVMSAYRIEAFYIQKDAALKLIGSYSINDDKSMMLKGHLVSIHPILNTDSPYFWLLAVTNTGHRGYFTCYIGNRGYNWWLYSETPAMLKTKEPNGLYILEVHDPPPQNQPPAPQQARLEYQKFRYFHGIFFAQRREGGIEMLSTTSPNYGLMFRRFIQNQEPIFSEHHYTAPLPSIFDIQEIHDPLYDPKKSDEYSNELINQFNAPPRKFILYTLNGIIIWTKQRPVDYLDNMLKKSNNREALKSFIENYGPEQTTAMCLLIASNESHAFMQTFAASYNTIYEGFAFCLARILLPVWRQKILKLSPGLNNTNPDRRDTNIPEPILNSIVTQLRKLKEFCDRHPMFKSPPQILGDTSTAQNASLSSLYDLLVTLSDAIGFILLMTEYNLPETIENISKSSQQVVFLSTYERLVTDQQVRSSWHDLVLAIIKRESGPRVDNLSRNLELRCPTFCNAAETKMYQGYEALQRAKKNEDEHTTKEALRNSLNIFCECINILTYGTLNNLCQDYKNFGFYEGAIELLLKAAQSFDPIPEKRNSILDLVIDTLRDAGVFADGIQRHTQSFSPVLQKALNLGTSLNDRTFLFAVYDEFLGADSIPQLFQPPAPYLEEYLNLSTDLTSPITRKKLDLYCDFCVTHRQYLKAAKVKEYIAKNSGSGISLQERLHYLSHAVGQAESAKELSETRDVIEALHKYRSDLGLAQIQFEIYREIDNIPDAVYNNLAALKGKPDKTTLLARLSQQLFDAQDLLRDFVIPFGLVERELSLVHAVEVIPSREDINQIWKKIIQKAKKKAHDTGSHQPIDDVVIESGRKYYPHDLRVFPMDTIVSEIAMYLIPKRIDEPGYITRILKQSNVAFCDIFNTFHNLFSFRITPFNTSEGICLLLKELVFILNQWMKSVEERYDIEPRSIHGMVSQYLTVIDHHSLGQGFSHEFLEIQRKLETFSTMMEY